ncbi:MAG TPA: hypothetical protein VIU64_00245, partial [Polyangia bacterium]
MKIVAFPPATEPGAAREGGSKGRSRSPSADATRGDGGAGKVGQGAAWHAPFNHAAPVAPEQRGGDQAHDLDASRSERASSTDASDPGERTSGAEDGAPHAGHAEHAAQNGLADRLGESETIPERAGHATDEMFAATTGQPTDGREDELAPAGPAPSFAVELARSVAAGSKAAPPAPRAVLPSSNEILAGGEPAEAEEAARHPGLPPSTESQRGLWERSGTLDAGHAVASHVPLHVRSHVPSFDDESELATAQPEPPEMLVADPRADRPGATSARVARLAPETADVPASGASEPTRGTSRQDATPVVAGENIPGADRPEAVVLD